MNSICLWDAEKKIYAVIAPSIRIGGNFRVVALCHDTRSLHTAIALCNTLNGGNDMTWTKADADGKIE